MFKFEPELEKSKLWTRTQLIYDACKGSIYFTLGQQIRKVDLELLRECGWAYKEKVVILHFLFL
jgi:hypothetical protein